MKLEDLKIGDFVYYTDFPECIVGSEERHGYGTIIEIKDIPKSFREGTDRVAIIQVKYFEDGTPCGWDFKEVIKLELLESARIAVERHDKELLRQLENMKAIRKEIVADK